MEVFQENRKMNPLRLSEGSSKRNAAVGALWPVHRRAQADSKQQMSGRCPYGCDAKGTVRHLAWQCEALDEERRKQEGGERWHVMADKAKSSDEEHKVQCSVESKYVCAKMVSEVQVF